MADIKVARIYFLVRRCGDSTFSAYPLSADLKTLEVYRTMEFAAHMAAIFENDPGGEYLIREIRLPVGSYSWNATSRRAEIAYTTFLLHAADRQMQAKLLVDPLLCIEHPVDFASSLPISTRRRIVIRKK